MRAILTITGGNKSAERFCRDLELTMEEFDYLKRISREINSKAGEECVTVYLHQV